MIYSSGFQSRSSEAQDKSIQPDIDVKDDDDDDDDEEVICGNVITNSNA